MAKLSVLFFSGQTLRTLKDLNLAGPLILHNTDFQFHEYPTYKIYCRHVLKTCNLTHAISINSDAVYRKIATSKTKPVKRFNKKGLIIPNKRTIEYFKNLNKTLVQDLLELYDPDFKMFQYSEEEFM